jgi:hypothetical protein
MSKVSQWVKDIFSEDNGEAVCVAKVLAVIAVLSFIGYGGFGLYKDHFDIANFASGMMQVLLGSGGIIAGKQLTQKKDE